jgi:hypothetical protein
MVAQAAEITLESLRMRLQSAFEERAGDAGAGDDDDPESGWVGFTRSEAAGR